jgi:hypothetical protein
MPHFDPSRRALLAGALAGSAALALPAVNAHAVTAAATPTATAAPVDYHAWTEPVMLVRPDGTAPCTDPHTGVTEPWEYAVWTSPLRRLSFGATQLVSSWNADTPAGTWIEVNLQGTYADGTLTPWYVMGRWARTDQDIRRTSVDGQSDTHSDISTDTFEISDPASGARLAAYRLRLVLRRRPGSRLTPVVRRIGAFASAIPDRFDVPASNPGLGGRAVELPVPSYSQDVHKGQYPQYDNGGEAWCSPTSSEMVVEYWGHRPDPAEMAWIDPSYADPTVDQAARSTYDYQYEGCGNWPFNAAYAASYGMHAAVTRLRTLNDAERLVAAGIPVITSQSFLATELDGAGYDTSGHLMALTGFTSTGDVIAHDPASPDDAAVRHVYRRHQFETVWLRTLRHRADGSVGGGSGGVVYLYWPARPSEPQLRALASAGVR